MGKLIFFDIDGTIAVPGQPPGQGTVAATRAARANGHKVFISTGRREADVPVDVRSIGFDGGIYSAGGRVIVGGKEILNHPMPSRLVARVTDVMRELNFYFMLESARGTYVGVKNQMFSDAIGQMIRVLEAELHETNKKQMPENIPVYKIVFLAGSKAQAKQLAQRLKAGAKVVCFGSLFPDIPAVAGEVSDWNINKGTAFTSVCQYLNVDRNLYARIMCHAQKPVNGAWPHCKF